MTADAIGLVPGVGGILGYVAKEGLGQAKDWVIDRIGEIRWPW